MQRRTRIVIVFMAGVAGLIGSPVMLHAQARGPDWSRLRTASSSILGWNVGISATSFPQLTLFETVDKTEAFFLRNLEGSSSQKVSADIPRNFDYNLTADEVAAVVNKLRVAGVRMPAYFTPAIGRDENACRRLFEFAKALGVETIVSDSGPDALPAIDRFANEFGIDFALNSPGGTVRALEGRSKRTVASVDTGGWTREKIDPAAGLARLKDRLTGVRLRDRSAFGGILREAYRLNLKPLLLTLEPSGAGDDPSADLLQSLAVLEDAIRPVVADRVEEVSRTTAIRGLDRLAPQDRARVEAAIPLRAPAKPRKPRRLLVMDLNVAYPGHRSIPAANLALELMGKKTGAFEAIFSNDMANLRYEKLRQFDAVYLNNTVGMIFPSLEVRESLVRFVREGGGLAGNHATPHASIDWPEFGEIIGARGGDHREPTERVTVKLDDPNSPINAVFGGKSFVFTDEFFRFPTPPYSRQDLHVLLSFDVENTDMNQGRACRFCSRPDNDFAISWIRGYGKGRVFYCSLGHSPAAFGEAPVLQHLLAGIQFVLGDLKADTTPSAKLAAGP